MNPPIRFENTFFVSDAPRSLFRRPTLGWALAAVIVLAAMIGGSLAVNAVAQHTQGPGVIIDAYASRFTEPLHAATEFTVQEQKGGWDDIRLPDDRTCRVPVSSVEMMR